MILLVCRLSSSISVTDVQMTQKEPICQTFGRSVRRYRQSLGLSQEALADKANIHRTYIGGIERGERNPTLTMIQRIASALGVSPDKLLKSREEESL